MAIHINEIVFKATIQDDKGGKSGGGKFDEKEKQKLMEEMMEQVIEMMRRKAER